MSNPVLNESTARRLYDSDSEYNNREITSSGVVYKTIMLFAILLCTAFFSYTAAIHGFADKTNIMMTTGFIGGLVMALFISFRPNSKYMIPSTMLYSALEGLAIGGLTGLFAVAYGMGVVLSAVAGTFTTLLSVLFLYKTGIIKCTEAFRSTIIAATLGFFVLYLITYISGFFTPVLVNAVHGNGQLAFIINIVACIVAAMNFVLDFDMIDNFIRNQLPEKFEWYCGFALMVTIIWLYIELLKLFARLNRK